MVDLVESLLSECPGPLSVALHAALAPSWAELESVGATNRGVEPLADFEVAQRADHVIQSRYLAGAFAKGLEASQADVLFNGPHRYDSDAIALLDRALRIHTDRRVTFAMPSRIALWERARQIRPALRRVVEPRPLASLNADDPATRILALCGNGAPLSVIKNIVAVKPGICLTWGEMTGPHGEVWVWMPWARRRYVLQTMTPAQRAEGHASIFHAWPADGWGYLRRAPHGWASRDLAIIASQALPVAIAARNLGPTFLGRHITNLAQHADALAVSKRVNVSLWSSAARLVSDHPDGRPSSRAIPLLKRAHAVAERPEDRVEQLYELANHYARTRRPAALKRARCIYREAFSIVDQIVDEEALCRLKVRLLNGLALVAYHQRRDEEALDLELSAQTLLECHGKSYPSLLDWGKPLLNMNTAKLLIRRFGDNARARAYIYECTQASDPRIRRRARIDLARLAFDQGDAREVVQSLTAAFESAPPDENEAEEAVAYAMLAVANIAIGHKPEASQALARVEEISRSVGLTHGPNVVSMLRGEIRALA